LDNGSEHNLDEEDYDISDGESLAEVDELEDDESRDSEEVMNWYLLGCT
jgi:hypothetical protein